MNIYRWRMVISNILVASSVEGLHMFINTRPFRRSSTTTTTTVPSWCSGLPKSSLASLYPFTPSTAYGEVWYQLSNVYRLWARDIALKWFRSYYGLALFEFWNLLGYWWRKNQGSQICLLHAKLLSELPQLGNLEPRRSLWKKKKSILTGALDPVTFLKVWCWMKRQQMAIFKLFVMKFPSYGTSRPTSWKQQVWQGLNIFPVSVLEAAGICRKRNPYYPSTPASNALLLSSMDDLPVRARMRHRVISDDSFFIFDSILRISIVAPKPSSCSMHIYYSTFFFLGSRFALTIQDRHCQVQ